MRGAVGLGLLIATVGLAFGACSPFTGDTSGDGGAGSDDAASGVDAADALSVPLADGGPGLDASPPDAAWTPDGCGGSTTFGPGLQAYWRFDDSLDDSTCHGRALSATMDCTGGVAAYTQGRLNKGFFPDLTNCALRTEPATLSFGSGDFTVSLWVYRLMPTNAYAHYTLIGNAQVFIGAWQTTAGAGNPFYPTIQLMNGGTQVGLLQDTTFDFANHMAAWVHIIAYRSGNMIGLRVNNVEHTMTLAGSALGAADTFYVGREGQGYTWVGAIDEVGIWNRALTSAEMNQLYNGGSGFALP